MGVAAVIGLVGAAIGAAQQKQQGIEKEAYADYQSEQSAADAQAAKDQAELSATAIRKSGRKQLSQANATLAASGVGLGSPGAININEDIRSTNEEDALNAIITGGRQSATLNAQSQAYKIGGKQAKQASNIAMVGTAIGAAGSYGSASGWYTSKATAPTNTVKVNS